MCTPDANWFTNGTVSFELIKGLPAALITALITLGLGGIAIQIQRQQARIATAKLNLDLFEKRLRVFDATWGIVSRPSTSAWIDAPLTEFSNLKPQAQFLFGQEIFNYMVEVDEKARTLKMLERQFPTTDGEQRNEFIRQRMQLEQWFNNEATIGCRTRFLTYLDFSKWR